MDLFQIEEYRRNLVHFINSDSSVNQKILFINEFITLLLQSDDQIIVRAYLPEFTSEFAECLKNYTVYFKDPEYSRKLLCNIKMLIDSGVETADELQSIYDHLRNELKEFEEIFSESNNVVAGKDISFPVIELFQSIGQRKLFGLLEHIQVAVFETKGEDSFIIVPSERDIDKRLNEQIRISWNVALALVKKYIRKVNDYHKIIVQFQSRQGFYVGDSLGSALVIMYVKKLLSIYNSPYLIDISNNISMTGGVDSEGNVVSVSDLIIQKKVETVFYSPVNIFVIPETDRYAAEESLKLLELKFPERKKLKIIGIRDIHDLFDRRSIIEIRKQNPVVRGGNLLRKNWLPAILLALLAVIFIFLYLSDLYKNPVIYLHDGHTIIIMNKNGKTLWTENVAYDSEDYYRQDFIKIADINNDGTNEVLISGVNSIVDEGNFRTLFCYNYKKEVVWKYNFTDSISTELEEHSRTYQISIIDLIPSGKKSLLYLIAKNNPFYPSAIFKLDASSGQRVDSSEIFWHAGSICDALIDDFNNDEKEEITAVAINNCYEGSVIFSLDLDNLSGQGPAEKNYVFRRIKIADINTYAFVPKSDYCTIQSLRFNVPVSLTFDRDKREFNLCIEEGEETQLYYFFSSDLGINKVNCGDSFEVSRDKLVDNGKLLPPYTNTKEYFGMLKNNVLYWNGDEFVKNMKFQ